MAKLCNRINSKNFCLYIHAQLWLSCHFPALRLWEIYLFELWLQLLTNRIKSKKQNVEVDSSQRHFYIVCTRIGDGESVGVNELNAEKLVAGAVYLTKFFETEYRLNGFFNHQRE